MAIAALKGPVDAVEEAFSGAVDSVGVSGVRRLTRLADDAPRREGALTEDWVWEPAINLGYAKQVHMVRLQRLWPRR